MAVDGLDPARRQAERPGGLVQGGAGAELVVELVRDRDHAVDRDPQGDFLGQFLAHLRKGGLLARLDLDHPQDVPAEHAFDRLAHGTVAQGEGGFGQFLGQGVPLHDTQVDRLIPGHFFGHGGEVGAAVEPRPGLAGLVPVLEHDLLEVACLRRHEVLEAGLELLAQLRLGNRGLGGQVGGMQLDQGDRAPLRGHEALGELLVKGFQRRLVGSGHVGDAIVADHDVLGDAPLVAVTVERLDQLARYHDRRADRAGELLPDEVAPQGLHVFAFAHAENAQLLLEAGAVEAAAVVLEGILLGDQAANLVVGHEHAKVRCLAVEQGAADHPVEHLFRDAEGARLVHVELAAEPRREPVDLARQRLGIIPRRDRFAANLRDRALLARPAEDVADAPDREAGDQQAEQHEGCDLDDEVLGSGSHGGLVVLETGHRAVARASAPGARVRRGRILESRLPPGNTQIHLKTAGFPDAWPAPRHCVR